MNRFVKSVGVLRAVALAAGVAVGLVGLSAEAAPNDFEIQASNVDALKVGDTFAKGARIVLPVGGAITLIDRTGSAVKTRECGGKYDGPVEACKPGAAAGQQKAVGGGVRGNPPATE